MSSAVESVSSSRLNARPTLWFDLLFGLLPLLLTTSLVAVECQLLWSRIGMRYFVVPILLVAALVAWNWRSNRSDQPTRIFWSRLVFVCGVLLFGLGVWRFSPWIAFAACITLFTGWAVERFGSVAWPSVLSWSALLATSMRVPADWGTPFQAWLINQSAILVGYVLDGLGIPFLIQADTFSMRDLEFSISSCCEGPYSFQALLSLVVLMLIIGHRSFLVAVLSLVSLPFWVMVQQTLLLLAVVLTQHFAARDATQGVDHALLELAAFGVTAFCLWMSIWFLARMLKPVPAADSQFEPEFLLLNSMLCWPQPDPFAHDAKGAQKQVAAPEKSTRAVQGSWLLQRVSWLAALAMIGLGGFATQRWAFGESTVVSATLPVINEAKFSEYPWKETFPAVVGRWRQMVTAHGYKEEQDVRRGVVDWQFDWQGQVVELQLVVPYNTRPRFAQRYESKGWRVLSERVQQFVTQPSDANAKAGSDSGSPVTRSQHEWTILKIANELGGRATAIVTYHPVVESSAVADQETPSQTSPSVEYQIVLFCESGDELTEQQLTELYNTFLLANDRLHEVVGPQLRVMLEDHNAN